MWVGSAVCRQFANNVGTFADNPGRSPGLFSANSGRRTCLFAGTAVNVCKLLQLHLGPMPKSGDLLYNCKSKFLKMLRSWISKQDKRFQVRLVRSTSGVQRNTIRFPGKSGLFRLPEVPGPTAFWDRARYTSFSAHLARISCRKSLCHIRYRCQYARLVAKTGSSQPLWTQKFSMTRQRAKKSGMPPRIPRVPSRLSGR